jgi:uncharacterized protein (TIGR00369 family)
MPGMTEIPDGFVPHDRKSPVTDAWEPLYSRRGEGIIEIGLRVASAHCNARGFLHGGVIAALADNAMGHSYGAARVLALGPDQSGRGAVTVNLSLDFIATARIGQWLQVTPRVLKAGGGTGFVDAIVTADGATIAHATAIFRVVERG